MNQLHGQERLNALFADLERLAVSPDSRNPAIWQELENLKARLLELEQQFRTKESVSPSQEDVPLPSNPQPRHNPWLVYEADQLGYAYAGKQLKSLADHTFIPDALITPLSVSGKAIGAIQIAPMPERPLDEAEVSLAHAVAHQVALQIQNLSLLAESERSRTEAESATRRFIHESWDSYMDAIQQSERIGYAYDQSAVQPFDDHLHVNGGVEAAINILDERIGTLYVESAGGRALNRMDSKLVHLVAQQVAQQVENIRLLADASRARAEAEQAIHRSTNANWQNFAEKREDATLGFLYDSRQVRPFESDSLPEDVLLAQPLLVGGEAIGQLVVAGLNHLPPEAMSLAASIASQASIHLETLRLNEELQKRARELQELDRLKSAFLANMSHELRTPLNSILGFSDVMLEEIDGPLTPNMSNDLRLIQKNGQHLLHLINDVLDMAKIESGRMNLHPEQFTIHSLVDEVVSITSTLASEKNTSLFIESGSDPELEIFADNTRIRQVMLNLVNNAIKFTEKGKISINVARMAGGRALISVKDTGLGIPSDHLEVIFQEFTQVDTSTTRKVGGTGLGLPISRRLVEMHGGRLWAESTGITGEGSTFFVELPLEARITEVVEKQEK